MSFLDHEPERLKRDVNKEGKKKQVDEAEGAKIAHKDNRLLADKKFTVPAKSEKSDGDKAKDQSRSQGFAEIPWWKKAKGKGKSQY